MAVRPRVRFPFDRVFDQWFQACDQWCDGAIFFINLCAGVDGRYWTRSVKSGKTSRHGSVAQLIEQLTSNQQVGVRETRVSIENNS